MLILWMLACGPTAPPEPPVPETLPTPFTAAQIRDGMPVGTTLVFRTTEEGQDPTEMTWEVVGATQDAATFHYVMPSPEGPTELDREHLWTELQAHAAFPADRTTVSEGTVDIAAGHFEVLRYAVQDPGAERATYHFVRSLPGPPVLLSVVAAGREVHRMELVSDSRIDRSTLVP